MNVLSSFNSGYRSQRVFDDANGDSSFSFGLYIASLIARVLAEADHSSGGTPGEKPV